MLTTALCNLRVTTAGHCFNDDSFTNTDEPTRLSLQHEQTTAFHFSHRRSLFLPSARLSPAVSRRSGDLVSSGRESNKAAKGREAGVERQWMVFDKRQRRTQIGKTNWSQPSMSGPTEQTRCLIICRA